VSCVPCRRARSSSRAPASAWYSFFLLLPVVLSLCHCHVAFHLSSCLVRACSFACSSSSSSSSSASATQILFLNAFGSRCSLCASSVVLVRLSTVARRDEARAAGRPQEPVCHVKCGVMGQCYTSHAQAKFGYHFWTPFRKILPNDVGVLKVWQLKWKSRRLRDIDESEQPHARNRVRRATSKSHFAT
jgi:hypothetical protein